MAYRFVAGIDYGSRKGTLGLAVHMAEGDNPVAWLARRSGETHAAWAKRVRGVSANFVITTKGEIVQMVAWAHASGSMNPSDQSDSAGFYRQAIIERVLGSLERDPNAWSLSVEIAGFRSAGPNDAQLAAMLDLTAECRRRYPGLRGAYGHADQTDTKGCPGLAPNMRDYWRTTGHGSWAAMEIDEAMRLTNITDASGSAVVSVADKFVWNVATGDRVDVPKGRQYPVVAACRFYHTAQDPDGVAGWLIPAKAPDGELHVLPHAYATFTPAPPSVDCTPAVTKRDSDWRAYLDVVTAAGPPDV